jgi:anti-anti-sigma factor
MTVIHSLATGDRDLLHCFGNLTIDRDGVDVRTQSRHLATVLTISGDIDARNTARISAYATTLVPLGTALLLDLSGVRFIAAQSISVLSAVEDACRSAELPWALVTSHAVDRVLRLSQDDDILPTVSSVPDAMHYFALLTRVRRQVPWSATRPNSARRGVAIAADCNAAEFGRDDPINVDRIGPAQACLSPRSHVGG